VVTANQVTETLIVLSLTPPEQIGSVFASLSGETEQPFPERFLDLKRCAPVFSVSSPHASHKPR
jgi:hypothetical protein